MTGRMMAHRLSEIARDADGRYGYIGEFAQWALGAEGDGAELSDLEKMIVEVADSYGRPTLPTPTDSEGNGVRVGDVLYAMKCRHAGESERYSGIPFVVASLAFDGDAWTASDLIGIHASLDDCRLMRFAGGDWR